MITPEAPVGFLLTCETAPGDLIEAYTVAPDLRRRRRRASAVAGVWLILFAVIAVISMALATQGGVRALGGLAAAAIGVSGFILAAYQRAQLSPGALARTVLRHSPRTLGVHTAEIGQAGVTGTEPDGSITFTPWTAITGIRESAEMFHLLDHSTVRISVPKRALASPGDTPALREFLVRAVSPQQPPAAAGPAAGRQPL